MIACLRQRGVVLVEVEAGQDAAQVDEDVDERREGEDQLERAELGGAQVARVQRDEQEGEGLEEDADAPVDEAASWAARRCRAGAGHPRPRASAWSPSSARISLTSRSWPLGPTRSGGRPEAPLCARRRGMMSSLGRRFRRRRRLWRRYGWRKVAGRPLHDLRWKGQQRRVDLPLDGGTPPDRRRLLALRARAERLRARRSSSESSLPTRALADCRTRTSLHSVFARGNQYGVSRYWTARLDVFRLTEEDDPAGRPDRPSTTALLLRATAGNPRGEEPA